MKFGQEFWELKAENFEWLVSCFGKMKENVDFSWNACFNEGF